MPRETKLFKRVERLHLIEKLFLKQPQKLRTSEIAEKFGISDDTALRDLNFLSSTGLLPLVKDGYYWQLVKESLNNDYLAIEDTKHYDYDVAFSYASEDRDYVDALAGILQREGVKVFYDRYEKAALWGQDLYTYLSDVYQNKARYCVMFLSYHYAAKLWTSHERQAAQSRAFKEQSAYILPIRLDNTIIPGILPTTAYLIWHQETVENIALAILEKLEDFSPKSLQKWHEECENYLKAGYKDKALIACKKAINIDPYDWFSYYKAGSILLKLKRYEEAFIYAEQGIKCDPTNCEDFIYDLKYEALMGLQRYEEALVVYEHILAQMHPHLVGSYILDEYVKALCNKGNAFFEIECYEKAFNAYEEAIQLDPKSALTYQNKGQSFYLLDRNEEALIAYEHAIKLDPQDAYNYKAKGEVLQKLKRYEDALYAYGKAIQLDSKDSFASKAKDKVLKILSHLEVAKDDNQTKLLKDDCSE